jgi:hypothetical protein
MHRCFEAFVDQCSATPPTQTKKSQGLTREDFEAKTRFFIETEIVPSMNELNAAMNDPARPWHRRAIDALKIVPEIGGAFLAGGPTSNADELREERRRKALDE